MIKMKTVFVLMTAIFVLSLPNTTNAQFWNKLKKHVVKKVENEAEKSTNKKADEAVDKAFDTVEEGAEDAVTGEGDSSEKVTTTKKRGKVQKSKNETNSNSNNSNSENEDSASEESKTHKPKIKWAKYDFVPGDKVIFEDAPSVDEESGEFPSRWDLYRGSTEIGEMDSEPVIMFLDGGGSIIPYLENSDEDYLPEVFTLEFDVYFEPGNHSNRYWVTFQDNKNQWQKGLNERMTVYVNGIEFLITDKRYPGTEKYNWGNNPVGGWKHISVAYTKGKFKAYMDDTRLINIPHLEGNPWGITIEGENDNMFIKNIRIAKGGVKYYDRFLSDGKIIVNGIRFDVNKATIKPESNGAINKIFKLMKKHSEVKFSVEGHTDGDGDDNNNLQLSEKRAQAVMDRLIELGINADRLEFKGLGESKPLDNNTTAEGKANNRRVEFVKI